MKQAEYFTSPTRETKDADSTALASLSDSFTRGRIPKFAQQAFPSLLNKLIDEINNPTVRSKLRGNKESFDGIMLLSQLRVELLAPSIALLGGFLYMAINLAVRQAEQREGRSTECYENIIDKLRRCNELGTVFYSRCTEQRAPANHVKERLGQAYSLHLSFIGAIVECLDGSPLSK